MLPPLVTVIQLTELVAVHAQLEPVTTEMLWLAPVDDTDTFVGVTVYAQLPAACVMDTVCPATVSTPVRATADVFAATL
jgi:hypothetical protein